MLVKKIQNSRFYGVDGKTTEMLVREPVATTITEVAEVSSTPTETQEALNIKEPFLSPSETTIANDEYSRDIPVVNNNTTNVEYNIETRPYLLGRTPILKDEVISTEVGGFGEGGGFGGGGGGAVEKEIIAPKKKSKWWLWWLVAGGIYGVSKMKKK